LIWIALGCSTSWLVAAAVEDWLDERPEAWLTGIDVVALDYAATEMRHARRRLVAFYQWCAEAEVPELTRLAKTISAWETEVLAFHTTGLSNGTTEAVNLLIEKSAASATGPATSRTIDSVGVLT
jgi:transposase